MIEKEVITVLTYAISALEDARRGKHRDVNIETAIATLKTLQMELDAAKLDTNYKYAFVVPNEGLGALLCSSCRGFIDSGFDHEDKLHFCEACR
jgi:hypothetical protein